MIRAREPCFGIVSNLGMQLTVLSSGLTVSLPVGFSFLKKQLLDDISGEKAAEACIYASNAVVDAAFEEAQTAADKACSEKLKEVLSQSGQKAAIRIRLGGFWVRLFQAVAPEDEGEAKPRQRLRRRDHLPEPKDHRGRIT